MAPQYIVEVFAFKYITGNSLNMDLSSMASCTQVSFDCGDELGITLFRQPPLPPPHPPGTYSPEQLGRWWFNKNKTYTLAETVQEFKDLFSSQNTYEVQYFDGRFLMPVKTENDLASALKLFVANSNNANICSLYLIEKRNPSESQVATIRVQKEYDAAVASVRQIVEKDIPQPNDNRDKDSQLKRGKRPATSEERLEAFKARILSTHGTKAMVIDEKTILCNYPACHLKVSCKSYNSQNFDLHVSRAKHSKLNNNKNLKKMFLTMMAQAQHNEDNPALSGSIEL